ncbi:MarR family winged helix-turn-helix transcriptional regulator [Pseudalkalibacillus salsuginis]|uniref:MarR family winged helix-turn-helix transcriptional regulator n=1 Tax=Pseudalkalibacillus salsuginis TaxID=2910972 RepID=UPI001F402B42|nr:MarR family transcriptional regulator [Pseudalkalibacillus salsuginis]MCF6410848.1 MarR family transcriptional regulator [Pseudalkalibacillus salsuginis]
MKDSSLELFVVLSRAYQSIMEVAKKDTQRFGLNLTEFGVLELLYHKGPHPLQKIGGKILLASGSITYVVDRLEEKGFLERKACERDRRITYAFLTEKGKTLMEDIFPSHAEVLQQALNGITESEKTEAIQMLKKLGKYAAARK